MRHACGERAHLKVILAVGELGSASNIYKASWVSMLAGVLLLSLWNSLISTSTFMGFVSITFTPFVQKVLIYHCALL